MIDMSTSFMNTDNAPAKSGAGIETPEDNTAHTTPDVVFLCVTHSHI
jgi:hypothetical protein